MKSFGIESKGAEIHLFISKGVAGDNASSVDDDMTVDSHQHGWDHQPPDQYQQSTQQYQNQQYNQRPPPPEQQHYQQQQYQGQGQHNYHTNQPLSFQQQQQFNPRSNVSYQSQHSTYNQYRDQSLQPPAPIQNQYYINPVSQFSDTRSQSFRANNYQPLDVMPEAMVKQPAKPARPPTPPKIGWTCPTCTVINEPYRPGCEACGENRPDDYRPPPGYTPTKDEVKWLENEVKERLHFEEVRMLDKLDVLCYNVVHSMNERRNCDKRMKLRKTTKRY